MGACSVYRLSGNADILRSRESVIEGDELTSLTLAYNNIGWGDNTYLPGHTYNADELRSNLLADDRGGLAGYAADIKALWLDNRDASHASLYYMLLRTSLLMVGHASVDEAVRWGCGLNIAIFVLTFFLPPSWRQGCSTATGGLSLSHCCLRF